MRNAMRILAAMIEGVRMGIPWTQSYAPSHPGGPAELLEPLSPWLDRLDRTYRRLFFERPLWDLVLDRGCMTMSPWMSFSLTMPWLIEAMTSMSGAGDNMARSLNLSPSSSIVARFGEFEPCGIGRLFLLVLPLDIIHTPRDRAMFDPAPEFHRGGSCYTVDASHKRNISDFR